MIGCGSKNSYYKTWKFSDSLTHISRERGLVEIDKAKERLDSVSSFGSKSQESVQLRKNGGLYLTDSAGQLNKPQRNRAAQRNSWGSKT